MSFHNSSDAKPFGAGTLTAAGAISDTDLARQLAGYKRGVAGAYRSLSVDELHSHLPAGPSLVSPKVDGQMWYLIFEDNEAVLVNPKGRVIAGDVPVLNEARKYASKTQGRTVVAGELWAVPESGRPRVASLATAMGGGADASTKRIAFTAFDLVWGGDQTAQSPLPVYADRLAVLERVFEGGKRVSCVHTQTMTGADDITTLYQEKVEGGRAEGLVVRAANMRTYKVKPIISIDAVVVGYTSRSEDPTQARSLLLALMREDGAFQLIGSVGNMGDEVRRREVLTRLAPLHTDAQYRKASSDGALYRFVRPEVVVQFRINDVQSTSSDGTDVRRMVLNYAESEWRGVNKMPGVIIFHPVFECFRDDKSVNDVDVRIAQVLERCLVHQIDDSVEATKLPTSHVLARRVFTKTTKGALAVRKIVAWKTNKESTDDRYPAYVVHFTDYSPGRKQALQRAVRCTPSAEGVQTAFEGMLEEKKVMKAGVLTRGWSEVEERRMAFE